MEARHGDERAEEDLARLSSAAATGGSQKIEIALPTGDGGRDWLALMLQRPGGGLLWSVEDVSPRRAIEETLKRDHEMLADFLDYMSKC